MRMKLKTALYGVLISCISLHTSGTAALSNYHGDIGEQLTLEQRLERTAVRYFLENSHPETGLVRASASNFKREASTNTKASIGTTGMALAVLANAGERGIINPAYARAYALKTLKFARDRVSKWKGWFVRSADWQSGQRWEKSEYSTIDTTLFLAGALYAAKVIEDPELSELAYELYRQTDFFEFLTDGGTKPFKQTMSVAYSPETGFSQEQWSASVETSLLLILGIGHPTRALPASTWLAWERKSTTTPNGETIIGADLALSAHQYSQLFIDFRGFRDAFNIDYFENGRKATEYNRTTCLNNTAYQSFRDGYWGLSTGLTPGGESLNTPVRYSSTACIGCTGGSAMYAPELILSDIQKWIDGPHGMKIWGRYGLIDSLDLDRNWFSTRVRGITVGALYLSLANINEDTSIWRHFREIPEIKKGMAAAAAARQPERWRPHP